MPGRWHSIVIYSFTSRILNHKIDKTFTRAPRLVATSAIDCSMARLLNKRSIRSRTRSHPPLVSRTVVQVYGRAALSPCVHVVSVALHDENMWISRDTGVPLSRSPFS